MNSPNTHRPLVALTVGDPAGIGREIAVQAARAAVSAGDTRVVILGPGGLRPSDVPLVDAGMFTSAEQGRKGQRRIDGVSGLAWLDTGGLADPPLGEARAEAGEAALRALRAGHDLSIAGHVDALVTGPVNKAALHLAGEKVEGQTELLGRWSNADRVEMIGLAGQLRVILVTRHMPLRTAIDALATERILDRTRLFDETLRGLGIERPRIAIAGLNPHAGEGGLLGGEDGAIVEPAVTAARKLGLTVEGPVSPDAVFAHAANGRYDGVVALYHDQAFIPLKLVGGDRGVTLLAGMPYLRFSPMHGTAFDIVGKRDSNGNPLARADNLIEALRYATDVSRARVK